MNPEALILARVAIEAEWRERLNRQGKKYQMTMSEAIDIVAAALERHMQCEGFVDIIRDRHSIYRITEEAKDE